MTFKIDSRTILGEQGAEQLLGQGDMLFMMSAGRLTRIHGPFVSDREVDAVVSALKEIGGPPQELIDISDLDEDQDGEDGGTKDHDPLFDKVVDLVRREGKASTSFIQRHFQIGYNRAARIMDQLERESIVGAQNHTGRREVL